MRRMVCFTGKLNMSLLCFGGGVYMLLCGLQLLVVASVRTCNWPVGLTSPPECVLRAHHHCFERVLGLGTVLAGQRLKCTCKISRVNVAEGRLPPAHGCPWLRRRAKGSYSCGVTVGNTCACRCGRERGVAGGVAWKRAYVAFNTRPPLEATLGLPVSIQVVSGIFTTVDDLWPERS